MAKETDLSLFLGESRDLEFDITNVAETQAIDISGWTLSFMVKARLSDPDASALITKSPASIAGAFDSDPAVNSQRASINLERSDSTSLTAGLRYWELKRTNTGVQTVVARGRLILRRGVHISV